jgi:hypothetical protein
LKLAERFGEVFCESAKRAVGDVEDGSSGCR